MRKLKKKRKSAKNFPDGYSCFKVQLAVVLELGVVEGDAGRPDLGHLDGGEGVADHVVLQVLEGEAAVEPDEAKNELDAEFRLIFVDFLNLLQVDIDTHGALYTKKQGCFFLYFYYFKFVSRGFCELAVTFGH